MWEHFAVGWSNTFPLCYSNFSSEVDEEFDHHRSSGGTRRYTEPSACSGAHTPDATDRPPASPRGRGIIPYYSPSRGSAHSPVSTSAMGWSYCIVLQPVGQDPHARALPTQVSATAQVQLPHGGHQRAYGIAGITPMLCNITILMYNLLKLVSGVAVEINKQRNILNYGYNTLKVFPCTFTRFSAAVLVIYICYNRSKLERNFPGLLVCSLQLTNSLSVKSP